MAGLSGAMKWAGDHPVILALGVFAVGAVVLITMRKPVVVQDSGMGAFYAAQAASAQSGNELAMVQAQVAGATALATIAGEYNTKMGTVKAQTDVKLAELNQGVLLGQQQLAREAQNKAYWQGVGQNAIQGQSLPYLLQAIAAGGTSAQAARDVMLAQIAASSQYYAAGSGS